MEKKIPTKNYFILLIVVIVTIFLTFYIGKWIKTYKENKLSVSPLSGIVEEININDVNLAFTETSEVILYVGYTNDKNVYKMEEAMLDYIKNNNIVDKFIYVNVTDYLKDDEYKKILTSTFKEVKDEIKNAPLLIYIKNGKAEKVVNSKDGRLYLSDVENLNNTYDLEG